MLYRTLADAVLITHALFVAFVIVGLLVILVGGWRNWAWVRNRWFRLAHFAAIGLVVAQAWLGVHCPLTVLENALRRRASEQTYPRGFVAYWVGSILFYDAPAWVFILAYTAFGLLVLAALWLVPVRWRKKRTSS